MSGIKTVSVVGASSTSVSKKTEKLGTGAVVLSKLTSLTTKAVNALKERSLREQKAAEKDKREFEQRITEIEARYSTRTVIVKPSSILKAEQKVIAQKDTQRKIEEYQNRLPQIKEEYLTLINQELLDEETVNQAFQQTKEALNNSNLAQAEAHLRTLDDARIEASQQLQQLKLQQQSQLGFIQERLEGLRRNIPQRIVNQLQVQINQANDNLRQLSKLELEKLHQEISEYQAQANRVWEAAENMVRAWHGVGYQARILGLDDGDVVIESQTHEGANTHTRIQFNGEEMILKAPHEEPSSCTMRTAEALKIFQQQGYYLQWENWNGEPVKEELQQMISVQDTEELSKIESIEKPTYKSRSQCLEA